MPPEALAPMHFERPGFVRQTASDRPGVAQPVPERDVPPQPWLRILGFAFALFLALLAAWEWHWRAFGREPGYRNSDGAWMEQRRRIDHGEGDATVLVGSSRVLFDVQPSDPAVFTLVLLVLGTAALVACIVPAIRATRVDPLVALRTD